MDIFCGGPCLLGEGLFALVSSLCFFNAGSDGARAASDSGVRKNDLEFLILLPPSQKYWNFRQAPCCLAVAPSPFLSLFP